MQPSNNKVQVERVKSTLCIQCIFKGSRIAKCSNPNTWNKKECSHCTKSLFTNATSWEIWITLWPLMFPYSLLTSRRRQYVASTAETTITIMYQFTHFFNVLKASLQEENEAAEWQPGITCKHWASGFKMWSSNQHMCNCVYVLTSLHHHGRWRQWNKRTSNSRQVWTQKTERRTSSKPSIYKQSKNAHFNHLFSFQ